MSYSTSTNPQASSLLFILPRELRDQIYNLAFTIKTNADNTIDLNTATKPPSKSLSLTCQRLHNETFALYKAAYKNWPTHTFNIDMSVRPLPADIPRDLANDLVKRMCSFRVFWHANEYNKGEPLRFVTSFDRDGPSQVFRTQVRVHPGDRYWRGMGLVFRAIQHYRGHAFRMINVFDHESNLGNGWSLAESLGYCVMRSVWNDSDGTEQRLWWGF